METTLKQRLIGAAVIIALAVIFVPMILDGSGREESVALNVEVPPEPTFTFDSELPDPKKLDELAPIEQSTDIKEPTAEKPAKQDQSKQADTAKKQLSDSAKTAKDQTKQQVATAPVVEATSNQIETNPALSAWAVQVAAFGEKGKAVALQEKLLASNLTAFTEQSGKGNKILYRVKVGPELEREKAEKLRDKIEKEHGLKGSFVIKHP